MTHRARRLRLIPTICRPSSPIPQEEEYRRRLAQAQSEASIDALTGVKNRHAYRIAERFLDSQIAEHRQAPFAVVIFDKKDKFDSLWWVSEDGNEVIDNDTFFKDYIAPDYGVSNGGSVPSYYIDSTIAPKSDSSDKSSDSDDSDSDDGGSSDDSNKSSDKSDDGDSDDGDNDNDNDGGDNDGGDSDGGDSDGDYNEVEAYDGD